MYQLLMRIPERPGARPAPWAHGMVGTAAECWWGMMEARKAGLVCKVNHTTETVASQMADHAIFDSRVDLGALV